ncbi:hypothetical protein [Arthrobacter sp. D5-1]|uniref:hypothetical protein n=1 Tax=Arthrobacter sp. D5-1 TaxID=1477518 RepID=UPI001A97DF34|nr:hypothetical protein [Arthrobacter sp. D5-1]QSZ47220.1 hypothetical protein AYX22_01515 [Arthrobacter sp. D5-1]
MSVYEATERSVAQAITSGALDENLSAGPVAAVLALARKIDGWDAVVEAAMEDREDGAKLPIPLHDNTSIPTYLRYCEALQLTPSKMPAKAAAEVDPIDELKAKRGKRAQAG